MIVRPKKVVTRTHADLTVTSDVNGAIAFHCRMDNGESWHKALDPQDAVKVWRRMIGEADSALHIQSPNLDIAFNETDDTWVFADVEVLCVLDLDECMLVAWAIEKAAGIALYNGPVHPIQDKNLKTEEKTSKVWLLVSSSRPGPISDDKECRGNAMAFASRESALDHLREFLREEVNQCHGEGHWEELEDHGRGVDDILDEIIVKGDAVGDIWTYGGTERSFLVELMETEVKR